MRKLTKRQRALKNWCKTRMLKVRDELALTAFNQARGMAVLMGLQAVAWRAGKDHQWVHEHIYGMVERDYHRLVRYGREAHFVPDGQPLVRSTGAQFCGREG